MSSNIKKPCVVLGVTGGIAVYKACELLRLLQKRGIDVFVVMTQNACRFVAPLTFETLSGHPVAVDTFDRPQTWEVEHIALAKRADLFLIVPATANIIGKMACGIADDMLSTTVMATHAPVMIAPAMNTGMWENPAVQQNIKTLIMRGVHVVTPVSGHLACGDSGAGKLEDVEVIARRAEEVLSAKRDLEGLRVLVTAGPSREALDPVRYISNRSSGKMGYSIAENVSMQDISDTDLQRVKDCLKRCGLWEFISALPQQELTHIGKDIEEDGIQLSGGQKQKLFMARALYRDFGCLLLDEPTAALDALAEKELYESYHELTQGTSSLFISHRLSSTRFCDEILVLDQGHIAERGSHDELLEKQGIYAAMFQAQSQYYEKEGDGCECMAGN